ncbi:hypothetical protein [Gynurincola endophyticus]|uniref:hypothetical protein n=1 Tax=Gynurincola endophyticus TaxID=2479004 RepID=UPI000F8EDE62|nr:hypothetical protein [Gynurincola endophyticus]
MKKLVNAPSFSYVSFVFLALLTFSACKKNEYVQEQQVSSRLVFSNVEELFQTLEQVEKLNDQQLKDWESQRQHASFRTYSHNWKDNYNPSKEEESLLALPTAYQVLLNKDGEFQVGDTIVWYNQGVKYYVGADQGDLLRKIKRNTLLAVSKGEYSLSTITTLDAPKEETINYPLNFLDASYQRPFTQQSSTQGTGCRKFVHEIVGIVDNWNTFSDPGCGTINSFYVRILLRIKMEWRNCNNNNYRPAGESRTVSYNLNKNIYLRNVYPPCGTLEATIPFTGIQSSAPFTTTSNVDVVLGGYAGNARPIATPYWEVSLSGTIYQYVHGDLISNEWNHVGTPFF